MSLLDELRALNEEELEIVKRLLELKDIRGYLVLKQIPRENKTYYYWYLRWYEGGKMYEKRVYSKETVKKMLEEKKMLKQRLKEIQEERKRIITQLLMS